MDYTTRTYTLIEGLALGDAIGVSSEFFNKTGRVMTVYDKFHEKGWPFVPVGRKKWKIKAGEHTDDTDMACCIVQAAYDAVGSSMDLAATDDMEIPPYYISSYFVDWLNTDPKDIGRTTRKVLEKIRDGVHWKNAGYEVWLENKENAANGSLMRNGVINGFTDSLHYAFDNSFLHGIITHYGPLPVLTCAIQTWIIHHLLNKNNPLEDPMWIDSFLTDWKKWTVDSELVELEEWLERVGQKPVEDAWDLLLETEWSHYEFNPFVYPIGGSAGYCLLTLQIALWALQWSLDKDNEIFPPRNLPNKVFSRKGQYCLGWIPMIGYDADTYAATAGPMFVAAHGRFPKEMRENLAIHKWLKDHCGLSGV